MIRAYGMRREPLTVPEAMRRMRAKQAGRHNARVKEVTGWDVGTLLKPSAAGLALRGRMTADWRGIVVGAGRSGPYVRIRLEHTKVVDAWALKFWEKA